MRHLISLRRHLPALAGGHLVPFFTKNPSVLGYLRDGSAGQQGSVLVLGNFSEFPQTIAAEVMSAMPSKLVDLIGQTAFDVRADLTLAPYQMVWLVPRGV